MWPLIFSLFTHRSTANLPPFIRWADVLTWTRFERSNRSTTTLQQSTEIVHIFIWEDLYMIAQAELLFTHSYLLLLINITLHYSCNNSWTTLRKTYIHSKKSQTNIFLLQTYSSIFSKSDSSVISSYDWDLIYTFHYLLSISFKIHLDWRSKFSAWFSSI